ncbi:hypothetical protein FQA39_LY17562 [Lamprigera yunnana]|nr:hypothetical protein FQA39_LY17562 [Lamprigera yunnana]
MLLKRVFITVSTLISLCSCANILGIAYMPSYSHQIQFRPIWRQLSMRGHQLTILTTDPMRDPELVNVTEIDLSSTYFIWNNIISDLTNSNIFEFFYHLYRVFYTLMDAQLSNPQVQELIRSNEKFDLAIIEMGPAALFAFAKKFNCSVIGINSLDLAMDMSNLMGSPIHPLIYPDYVLPVDEQLSFGQRLYTFTYVIFRSMIDRVYGLPLQLDLIEKHFGYDRSDIADIFDRIDFLFVNSDPIFYKVKPLPPNIVQIGGGLHRTPPKPLPEHIKEILDSASDGFIYFSLGTNIKSTNMPTAVRETILATFAELPYKVLWKFEEDHLLKKTENVVTKKWLPQQDILRHKHIKLFITQGGLQSIDEAVYEHVPMVIMPIYADQIYNARRMVARGLALSVDYNALIKEEFKSAILEVIDNPTYKKRAKKLTELARDQPMTGLEKAIWWTEYVIRHNGAKHLRSPLKNIPDYQYYLIDVMAVFIAVIFALYVILKLFMKGLSSLVIRKVKMVPNRTAQWELIVNFMPKHMDFARSRLNCSRGRSAANELWCLLTKMFAAAGFGSKEVGQWQKIISKTRGSKNESRTPSMLALLVTVLHNLTAEPFGEDLALLLHQDAFTNGEVWWKS